MFSLFWCTQRPPMAPIGSRGDVHAPWGGWLAFGEALVRPGGLPALVSAGRCCWAEGQPLPLWCCCGGHGASSGQCNSHPTHREPARCRLWVVGGVGSCKIPVSAVIRACWPPQCRPWSNSRPTRARIYGTHRHGAWHHTTPNPLAASAELPVVGWPLQWAGGTPHTWAPQRP